MALAHVILPASCDHQVPTEGQVAVDDGLHGNTLFECTTLDDQVKHITEIV